VYGLTASVLVAFWDVMTGRPAISFLYIGVVGLVFDLGVGYLVSRFGPSRDNRRATWWTGVVLFVVLIVAVVLLLAKF
jgi:FtsH-binding integral membrane protein